ncbi:KRUF family protein [Besnoitia besnoiti]|uniref:KRUF family protein n=1 Tax=Besnoitia besnoiti TaxID=94643 RepID=A0A2A9MDW9_BESBE|nr:KRUF family protein [Besnoitia besnoiti]PFH33873.1 KRUF family protein [Besnoitia besnoiti]
MVHQKRPPSLKTVLRWIDIISKKYDEGARVHLQQAARLDRRVADVEAKLTAAHVKVPAAPRPPSQDIECPRTLRDASDYGDATKTTADSAEFATQCLRLGIQQLKKEAADLKAKWKDQQVFIAQSLATNVAFHSAPSASMRQTKKWAWAATACYKLFAPARLRDAVQNEAKARQAEQWLAEGIFDATRAVRLPCSNTRRAGLTGTSDPRRVSPDSSRQEPSEDMQQHDGEASAPPASSASSCPSEDINLRGTLLASTAYHAGDIPITYGELAVRKMRKTARQLLRTWTNKDTFVYQHVAQRMLREEIRDLDSDELDRWRRRAARTYSEGWRYRIRNATDMLIDAANLEARLAAAGVAIRTSPSTNADDTEARGPSTTEFLPGSLTFAELAVEKLRHDASEIRHVWGRGRDTYVAQRVADHMVHQKHPAPHPAAVRQLTKSAVATYKRESRGKLRLALKMETEADQVEKEVAAARERARSERRSPTQSALRGLSPSWATSLPNRDAPDPPTFFLCFFNNQFMHGQSTCTTASSAYAEQRRDSPKDCIFCPLVVLFH